MGSRERACRVFFYAHSTFQHRLSIFSTIILEAKDQGIVLSLDDNVPSKRPGFRTQSGATQQGFWLLMLKSFSFSMTRCVIDSRFRRRILFQNGSRYRSRGYTKMVMFFRVKSLIVMAPKSVPVSHRYKSFDFKVFCFYY